jgi:anti-sigma regulatory factor (Ser/Thr protein kinase)
MWKPGGNKCWRSRFSDAGPGIDNLDEIFAGRYRSSTGMGLGILGTKRLMDNFELTSSSSGTVVKMGKDLPLPRQCLRLSG